jgi:hypothetical protein
MELGSQFAGEEGIKKMLTQILCIGSDFDGIINGLEIARDCTAISELKIRFITEFPNILKTYRRMFTYSTGPSISNLPNGLSIEKVADRIFYENGRDFILNRLEK